MALMNQSNKLSKAEIRGRIIFVVLLFLICGIAGKMRSDNVKKHGVWTILELTHLGKRKHAGVPWVGYYKYEGNSYEATQFYYGDEGRYIKKGMRYFIQVLPDNPKKKQLYGDLVPEWFTLEAPPRGWVTKPTEEELWEMMVQELVRQEMMVRDSVLRGLK